MTSPSFKKQAKECPRCHSDQFDVAPGKGPHAAKLQCAKCTRFMWWLKKEEYKHLVNHYSEYKFIRKVK